MIILTFLKFYDGYEIILLAYKLEMQRVNQATFISPT